MTPRSAARYTAVAIALHWAIAAAILANLALGWWMHEAIEEAATQLRAVAAYQLHKSLGLTVLALTLLRLAWRLTHRAPALPAGMPRWEHMAARAVHWAFYVLLVLVPLSGWTYVSAQWRGNAPLHVPTLWFGLFQVPDLFDPATLSAVERKAVAARNVTAHAWLAWATAGLLAVHVAAALRHRFAYRDGVLASMAPAAGAGIVAGVVVAVAAALYVSPVRSGHAAVTSARGGWSIDPASTIAFSGTHAGVPFHGTFLRWEADLRFNPLGASIVTAAATIDTASAHDGVPLHEEMLRLPEWFDVTRYPQARFVATRIAPRPGGGHTVEGALTVKDRVIAVPPLDLVIDEDTLAIRGRFAIDRSAVNLGLESDPAGDYVSRRIEVDVDVRARRR